MATKPRIMKVECSPAGGFSSHTIDQSSILGVKKIIFLEFSSLDVDDLSFTEPEKETVEVPVNLSEHP